MAKYRKKPTIIEAVLIETPAALGPLQGKVGDYLITHSDGRQHFCDPEVFNATYEPIQDGQVHVWALAEPANDNGQPASPFQGFKPEKD